MKQDPEISKRIETLARNAGINTGLEKLLEGKQKPPTVVNRRVLYMPLDFVDMLSCLSMFSGIALLGFILGRLH